MDYLPRIADKQLDLTLEAFGGALIKGPKGCGKTTTAKQRAKTVVEFQNEDVRENLLMIANTAPSKLLAGEKPILFDEWHGRTRQKYGARSARTSTTAATSAATS